MRALSILLLLGLAACGNSGAESGALVSDGTTEATAAPFRNLGLLEQVMRAPSATVYSGQREAAFYSYDKYGAIDKLAYTETVISDGDGQFVVVIDDLLVPVLSPGRVEVFKMIQKGREEFFYNHRDFRVRDLDLVVRNYQIFLEETRRQVRGRSCLRLLIRRNIQGGSRYEVDVDERTGLVLDQREYDTQDRLVSQVKFLQLSIGTLTPEEAVALRTQRQSIWRSATPRDGLDGLAVHAPSFPPTGFQLLEQRIVTDPLGDEWYELIYGDGIEQMFMLYALNNRPSQSVQANNEVAVFRHGRWTVVDGILNDERVIALGKVSSDDLMLALESSL